MAGDSGIDESQFKGWQKYFNTYTDRGRFNLSVTTVSVVAGIGVFFFIKSKLSKKKVDKVKDKPVS